MNKVRNQFSLEVRESAVRIVLENLGEHGSRRQAIAFVAAKFRRSANSLNSWVKKAEVYSGLASPATWPRR